MTFSNYGVSGHFLLFPGLITVALETGMQREGKNKLKKYTYISLPLHPLSITIDILA